MKPTTLAALAQLSGLITPVAMAQDDAALLEEKTRARLEHLVAEATGVVGYEAIDLVSGRQLGLNQNLVFPQASAIKIPILMEVFRQARIGRLSLEEKIPFRSAMKAGGSGVLQHFSDGTSELSLRDLCVLMILLSDNTATNILINRVSMDSVNAMLRGLGLAKTALNRVMMDAAASAQDRENTSSPAEAVRIMAILHDGTFVDRPLCEEVLEILSIGKGGSFERVFPDSLRVAWKPGGIAGVQTVWVLVRLPERPFAFAVMEKFDSAGEAGKIQQEVARVLFDYFWRLGNASRYGTFVDPALRPSAD